jgi:hypothetical protein
MAGITPNNREILYVQGPDQQPIALQANADGELFVVAQLDASDIEIGAVELKNGTDDTRVTVFDYSSSNPLAVRLTDTNGDYIAAGAGTQYTSGDATPATPTGTIPVYDNGGTIASVSTTNRLPVSAAQNGTWNINNVSGTISLPTGAATAAKQPALGTAGTASADVITVQGIASMTALKVDGSAVTQPISAAALPLPTGAATSAAQTTGNTSLGTIAGAVSGTEMQVDVVASLPAGTNNIGDVDVLSIVPGTGATNLGKAEDGAHTSGDVGVMSLGVRNDTMVDFSGADNDYTPFSVTPKGQVITANAPRGRKLHQKTTITSSTSETTVLTAAASTFHDVYGVIVTNTSATATEVTFKDATAGTTRFIISAPANDTRGFMLPVDAAFTQAAVNNNWTATCADSVASIEITVIAVKNL